MDTLIAVPDRILRISHAFQEAKVLLSAVELGIFTALANGPLDAATLCKRLDIDARGAHDFLDALVALRLLERTEDDYYTNTAETACYLDQNQTGYVGGELEFLNSHLYAKWNSLTSALRTGKAQSGAAALGNYPARYADDTELDRFVKAMTAQTLWVAKALAVKFPWCDYKTVVDIGCGQGCLPVQLAQEYPHLTGGGFDLPALEMSFNSYVQAHGDLDRLHFFPGDFFQDALPTADVLVMGRVLHNWDLATKKMLLAKAYSALPAGGALIVYERLIDDERRINAAGLLASLNMLIMTAGGFDFTGADCVDWMQEAGFRNMRIEPLTTDQSMVVGIK
jgi:SAM-dependent methyltransferase